jgi:hypothetical protein
MTHKLMPNALVAWQEGRGWKRWPSF